jgi:hypothetical protein
MQAEQPHIELPWPPRRPASRPEHLVFTLGSKHVKTLGHPYWLQAPLPAYEFLRTVSELPVRESNAAAERAGDERLDIQADLSRRQSVG